MAISSEKPIERRLSRRILQKITLSIKCHATGREIHDATIVNISIGGMQFFIQDTVSKLHIGEVCSFVFDLPVLGETNVLGEIRYYRDFTDPESGHVVHYGVKFIHISKKTWNLINKYCQNDNEFGENHFPDHQARTIKTTSGSESLTAKTMALIKAQVRLDAGSVFKGKVLDINFGGIQLQLLEPIPVNVHLDVHVAFEDQSFTTDGLCNCCSNTDSNSHNKPGPFLVNIGFYSIAPQQFENLQSLMFHLANHIADSIDKVYFKHESGK